MRARRRPGRRRRGRRDRARSRRAARTAQPTSSATTTSGATGRTALTDHPSATDAPATTRTPAPVATRACRPAPGYTAGHHDAPAHGRGQRHACSSCTCRRDPTAAMRLVVDFHGATLEHDPAGPLQRIRSGRRPERVRRRDSERHRRADSPMALPRHARRRELRGSRSSGPSRSDACVDPRPRVRGRASRAAARCRRRSRARPPSTFAGFGLVSADFYLPADLRSRARQRPIIIFHGTADPVVPYYGGHVGNVRRPARRRRGDDRRGVGDAQRMHAPAR